ncbi:hypothetical protein [Streptomyces prasinus]|uniref:hypothetical protein n=1 Tax=Streptomyces prasinus TaxID=67345 RepID=UPI0033BF4E6D
MRISIGVGPVRVSGRLGGSRRRRRLTAQQIRRRNARLEWLGRVLRLNRQESRKPAAPLDPAMVATMTYTVVVAPTRDGWDLKVQDVGKTACVHLGEVESTARELIVFSTGMPPERILLDVKRV